MAKKLDSISPTGKKEEKKAAPQTAPPVETIAPAKEAAEKTAAPAKPMDATPAPSASPEKSAPADSGKPAEEPAPETEEGKDSYETMFPEPSVVIGTPPTWIWWLLLLIASVLIALLGYQLVSGKLDRWLSVEETASSASPDATPTPLESASPTPEATATPVPTATPTPASTPVTASSVTLRVLNGSGKSGAAASAKAVLTKAGFSVRTVGNAQRQNYAATVIYYQSGRKAEAEAVQKALSSYQSSLEESSLASPDMVLVIVGDK